MDRQLEKKFWNRQRRTILFFGAILVLLILASFVADLGTKKLKIEATKLTLATATEGPFQEFIAVNGMVAPLKTVYLDTVKGGRVEELLLEAGNPVSEGTPILRLVNAELEQEALRREDLYFDQANQLANTRQEMERQRRDFEKRMTELDYEILKKWRVFQRNEALRKADLLADLEFELSRDEHDFLVEQKKQEQGAELENKSYRDTQVRQMAAALARREKDLAVAREQLDRLVLRSPIDGLLTSRAAEVGQSIAPGQRLAQVDSVDGFKLTVGVDQHFVSRVDVGLAGRFEQAGKEYELRVVKVYPEVAGGKFAVDMEFIGAPPEAVRRGQSLSLRLALGDVSEALLIRNGAFFLATGGQWIFVLDEAGQVASQRRIRLGRRNPDSFEVLEGLASGERVITSSYEAFEDYDELILQQ